VQFRFSVYFHSELARHNLEAKKVLILSMELLTKVEQAEAAANEIHAEALREAREVLKSAEEAELAADREASALNRKRAAQVLEDARLSAAAQIQARRDCESTERAAQRDQAMKRIDRAVGIILERVVTDGRR